MNELLFMGHVLLVMGFVLGALVLGRGALVCSVVMNGVLANLFVGKQMALFGFSVTCADPYVVGAVLSLSLLQERFGEQEARRATFVYLLFSVWYLVMTQVHLAYEPLLVDQMHLHFEAVFGYAMRVVVAGIVAMMAGLWVDGVVLKGLTRLVGNRLIWGRVFGALVASQVVDTGLFGLIGLWGFVASIWQVMAVSLVVKVSAGLLATPFVGLARWVTTHSVEN